MSVHASNNESRRIILPDELESIFHVLLNLAVRFLPHNLPDENVGQFLYDYFDDYSPHASGFRCGPAKRAAITSGVISLEAYNGDQDPNNSRLRFGFDPSKPVQLPLPPSAAVRQVTPQPVQHADTPSGSPANASRSPSPASRSTSSWGSDNTTRSREHSLQSEVDTAPPLQRTHPLNTIIDELLKWFQAYYALEKLQQSRPQEAVAVSEKTKIPSQGSKVQKMRQKTASRSTSSLTSTAAAQAAVNASPTAGPTATAAQVEELWALADKLMSHQPFIDLIDKTFEQEWPENDKGKDKKPKKGVAVRKSQVPAASETHTSARKRKLEEKDATKERKRRNTSES